MTTPPLETAPRADFLQTKLQGYDQFNMIALGGMGAVYRARQISLDRPVAVKVLTHACSSSAQFRQIFQAEAKVMARLSHPNLVSIYDYGVVDDMPYIVMEYVEGRSLYDACFGQAVKQHEAAQLVATLATSLSHAHHAGILHRDIKPANILIDSQIRPVIVDFGLAQNTEESTAQGDTVFGTPGYTAPEVLAPPYRADQRADIFSLGVVLHELLTGETPRTPYLSPSQLAPVDPRYDDVVRRAIHPQPAMRYSLAEDLAADLETILAGKELSPTPLLLTPSPTEVNHPHVAGLPLQPHPTPAQAQVTAPTIELLPSLRSSHTPRVEAHKSTKKPNKWAIAASLAAASGIGFIAANHAAADEPNQPEPPSHRELASENPPAEPAE